MTFIEKFLASSVFNIFMVIWCVAFSARNFISGQSLFGVIMAALAVFWASRVVNPPYYKDPYDL